MSSDLKVTNIKHASSGSNNLVLASDGDISVTNNLNVGTIKDATGNTTAMQINSSGHVTRNVIPSFNLKLSSTQDITTANDTTIQFEDTSANNTFLTGGCSVSSGVVTVPTAGLYHVGANLRIDEINSGFIRMFITKNADIGTGEPAYIINGSPDSTYDNITGSIIFLVTTSDISSNANNFRVILDTGGDTSYEAEAASNFWGYLIG